MARELRRMLAAGLLNGLLLVAGCGGAPPTSGGDSLADGGGYGGSRAAPAPASPPETDDAAVGTPAAGDGYGYDADYGYGSESGGSPAGRPESPAAEAGQRVVELVVEAREYEFSPSTLVVPAGATVRLTIRNTGQKRHDWALLATAGGPESGTIAAGETGQLEFVAAEPGTYHFVCTQQGHRARGMEGTLVVQG